MNQEAKTFQPNAEGSKIEYKGTLTSTDWLH